MQRHDDTVKTPPEAQEHGTQHPLTCHYCGRAVCRTATVEACEEAGDHRWENLARGLTGDGGA
jgi:hypothetical protein